MALTLQNLTRAQRTAALVGAGVVLVVLVVIFSSELFVRTLVLRVRVKPSKIEPGSRVAVRWTASRANRARYPFERISLCEARRRGAGRCIIVLVTTPNDGSETFRVSPKTPPGVYRVVLQALDANRRPVTKARMSSGAVRVIEESSGENGGDGGGGDDGGGGGGRGGGDEPPPPPTGDSGGHGGEDDGHGGDDGGHGGGHGGGGHS